ncbi:MAG: hypothetical protein SAK29_18270 [Scytonema sp. PMC 1069.18]|nr:hypothetical protein [Scytonema sp. PMC 1069.18]MEC4887694.1 hypothetical protein [Scytonema sp. PMC 1070.18]
MGINWTLKGTPLNPYEWDEFPRHHVTDVSPEELKRLEETWNANPQIWEQEQPDFELLAKLAGIER